MEENPVMWKRMEKDWNKYKNLNIQILGWTEECFKYTYLCVELLVSISDSDDILFY